MEAVGYGGRKTGKADMTGMEEDMTEADGMRSGVSGLSPAGTASNEVQ